MKVDENLLHLKYVGFDIPDKWVRNSSSLILYLLTVVIGCWIWYGLRRKIPHASLHWSSEKGGLREEVNSTYHPADSKQYIIYSL